MIYRFDCTIYKLEDRVTSYIEETSRTAFERGLEQADMMRLHSKESPMVEHQDEAHQGQTIQVQMSIVKKLKKMLDRKVREGTLIAESAPGTLMKGKG